ncbi:MAG TPA: type II toxin-antitoxin system prevent-host-death family antitoxin [Burkholderiaceae bacterium]|nr:type II toxin-antitoxin system prevent-host-death family antitoxin [Burkholderiaceae bacterium]
MDAITFSDARRRLAQVADDAEADPVFITRAGGETLVLMNAQAYTSILETIRLYTSPKNRADLDRAIKAVKRGETVEFDPTA